MTRPARLVIGLALAVATAGCGVIDPMVRPGTLTLDDAPTVNAASMVVDPYDMLRGRGTTGSDGEMAAAAVDRARTDTIRPLLSGDGGMTPSAPSSGAQ